MLKTLKRIFILSMLTVFSFSCKKNQVQEVSIPKEEGDGSGIISSSKWGPNDEKYKGQMIEFAKKFKAAKSVVKTSSMMACTSSAMANTYGYYNDPENLIVGGSYIEASSASVENNTATCASTLALIEDAKTYLTNEGYGDIVRRIYGTEMKFRLIHAANALVDLKSQFNSQWARTSQQGKLFNCIFQALGFSALAELGANFFLASKQVILAAVGKIATRYLGFFGAAIAVVSFVDCMWG